MSPGMTSLCPPSTKGKASNDIWCMKGAVIFQSVLRAHTACGPSHCYHCHGQLQETGHCAHACICMQQLDLDLQVLSFISSLYMAQMS